MADEKLYIGSGGNYKLLKSQADGSVAEVVYVGAAAAVPGAAFLATSQPAPLVTKTTLAIARATRVRCVVLNRGGTQVYVGPDPVTAVNGFLLDPGASVPITWVGLIQGISIGATGQCYVLDEYN